MIKIKQKRREDRSRNLVCTNQWLFKFKKIIPKECLRFSDLFGSLVMLVLRTQKEAVYPLLIVLVVIVSLLDSRSFCINIQRIVITNQRPNPVPWQLENDSTHWQPHRMGNAIALLLLCNVVKLNWLHP